MNKKVLLPVLMIFLFTSMITAAWYFGYSSETEAEVQVIGSKLEVIVDLSDFVMNTSEGNVTHWENLTLNNKKDWEFMNLTLATNKTLTEPSCPNWQNDCSVEFWNATQQLYHGDLVSMYPEENNFTLRVMCVENSCGQNITTTISLDL